MGGFASSGAAFLVWMDGRCQFLIQLPPKSGLGHVEDHEGAYDEPA
jgi:hypothetical protein